MKRSFKVLAVVAGVLVSWQAHAISITGEIAFGGVVTPIDGTGAQTLLGQSTGLTFDNTFVWATTGVFADANLPFAYPVTVNGFQFFPSLDPKPLNPLWDLTYKGLSFSFELRDIAVDLQSDTQLNLTGIGVLRGSGYDDTWGTWNFQAGSSTGGLEAMVTFRADSAVSRNGGGGIPVPDTGTTAMLLGLALTSLGVFSRRLAR